MNKKPSRILAALLAIALLLSCCPVLPVNVRAEKTDAPVDPPSATVSVTTGNNDAPVTWIPELYEGMTPAYAKTSAEGSLILEGASESDYNLKAEWPTGGKPTLILKNATLVNNTYYVDTTNPAKNFIDISGVEDFEIIVKGTNVFNGRHDTKPLTTAAYRSPTGIKAQNEGTLVIKGESKADTWTIDNYSGAIIEKYYNSLTIENVTFAGYLHNTRSNGQFGISMIAYKEACLDKTDLIVQNADFTIEGNKYYGNCLIQMCGTKSNIYSATNTSDIVFKNSKIRIYRNNSTSSSQEGSTTIKTGENSTITIDRCDVLVYSRHRTFNYWPALKNITVVTAGDGVLAPGTKVNSSTLPKLELTHACCTGDCTIGGTCPMCGKTVAATQGHVQAADDGDCTTDILCANPGCAYVFAAGNAAHTPAADDNDCATATPCTICSKIAIPAPGHTHNGRESCDMTAYCTVCGKVALQPSMHKGGIATCQAKAKCATCGVEYGELGGHSGGTATCQAKAKCATCGVEYGELGGHSGGTATCQEKAVCITCGQEYGVFSNHTGGTATCQALPVCSVCGQTYGRFGGHSYTDDQDMTCNIPGCTNVRAAIIASGTCGINLTWTLDVEGNLTISGTGSMYNYSYSSNAPWYSYYSSIQSLVIENGVTTIGDYAFYACSSLTSITIGGGVTAIGDSVFRNCHGLTSIAIPDGVATIGNYAFYNCSGLTNITIPSGVISIGNAVFFSCDSLTAVNISDSVTTIGESAFSGCSGLAGIWVDAGNVQYSSDSYGVLFNKNKTMLIQAPNAITSAYEIPNSVTSIGSNAFAYCSNLTSVTIPDSVTTVGNSAFSDCSSLTSITIPESVTTIGDWAFYSCDSLTSVTIGNSVTSIGNDAFRVCSSLTSVTIGNSVTSIGGSAFSGCSSLTSVTIPGSVTSIGNYAFSGCSSLTGIWVDADNANYSSDSYGVLFDKNKTILIQAPGTIANAYVMPDSVTLIGDYAFAYCSNLTAITIPDSVVGILDSAFYLLLPPDVCGSLIDIYYTGTQEQWEQISIASGNTQLYNATLHTEFVVCSYGDATGDGLIDGMDVIRLKKYLANYNYDTETSTVEIADGADATGDGVVDGMDVIRLKKYLANFNYETGTSTIPLGPQ